jgi:hypothetical protein
MASANQVFPPADNFRLRPVNLQAESPIPDERLVELKPNPEILDPVSGSWAVKSPTGLVLEFPESALLVNWSAVVENPAPYQVSRGGETWMSLEEFLRETKRGVRATQAFRRTLDERGSGLIPVPLESVAGSSFAQPQDPVSIGLQGEQPGAPGTVVATQASQRNAVSTTAQFTFKIATNKKTGFPRWAVALIVGGVLVLLGSGAAVAFLFLK